MANPIRPIQRELAKLRRLMRRRVYLSKRREDDIVGRFHMLLYDSHIFHAGGKNVFWLGTPISKCPFDLWIYQELLHEIRPDLIVECGTFRGGSAFYLASLCDLLGRGEVITIDVQERPDRPTHPRVTYLTGSSTSPEVLARVREAVAGKATVMAILDSNHSKAHVLQEMRLYGPLVTRGSYLVVEDSNLNGNPVVPDFGPGPMEAIEAYLKENDDFAIDEEREKFFVTFNPKGYLRKLR